MQNNNSASPDGISPMLARAIRNNPGTASDHTAPNQFGIDLTIVDDATQPFDVGGLSTAKAHAYLIDDDTGAWTNSSTNITIQESLDGVKWLSTGVVITAEGKTGVIDCRGVRFLRAQNTAAQVADGKVVVVFHADESDPTTNPAATSGASFPSDPNDGQQFYRTDLDTQFWWDAGRAKWLGWPQTITSGNSNTSTGMYMKHGSAVGGTTRGWLIPYPVTVTEATVNTGFATVTANIELRVDGASQGVAVAIAAASEASATDVNIDLAAGGRLCPYISASIGDPAGVTVGIVIRRRET